jgi:SynChlorMet cassette protein ScmC
MSTSMFDKGYRLILANGQRWHLRATEELRPWARKMASIMQLNNSGSDGFQKLTFTIRNSGKETKTKPQFSLNHYLQKDLPARGWKLHDLFVLNLWSHPDVPDLICEMGDEDGYDLAILRMRASLYPLYRRAQSSGGFPLHAALIKRNGVGILLAASNETGKSTCCRRLPAPWKALCDEESLIVSDNHKNYQVHPFPTWSDYLGRRSERSWNVQQHLPLAGIFLLEQAHSDEIVSLGRGEAAACISQSSMQAFRLSWTNLLHKEIRILKQKIFESACELVKAVPTFKLHISLSGQFWKEIDKVL